MQIADMLPATSTRVERNTPDHVNEAIAEHTHASLVMLERAPTSDINARLAVLDREWDVERVLQTNASLVVLTGLALAWRVDRRFLMLPAAVFSFFAQHALQGWCPPLPLLRRLGVRTAREIERERYALKALRGDFDALPAAAHGPASERVRAVLGAIDA